MPEKALDYTALVEHHIARSGHDQTAIDENGVDRTQIRQLLELNPQERLQRLQEFMDAVETIRALNGVRSI